jgi:hypothetical protein
LLTLFFFAVLKCRGSLCSLAGCLLTSLGTLLLLLGTLSSGRFFGLLTLGLLSGALGLLLLSAGIALDTGLGDGLLTLLISGGKLLTTTRGDLLFEGLAVGLHLGNATLLGNLDLPGLLVVVEVSLDL